jgi:hypothetical protein
LKGSAIPRQVGPTFFTNVSLEWFAARAAKDTPPRHQNFFNPAQSHACNFNPLIISVRSANWRDTQTKLVTWNDEFGNAIFRSSQ